MSQFKSLLDIHFENQYARVDFLYSTGLTHTLFGNDNIEKFKTLNKCFLVKVPTRATLPDYRFKVPTMAMLSDYRLKHFCEFDGELYYFYSPLKNDDKSSNPIMFIEVIDIADDFVTVAICNLTLFIKLKIIYKHGTLLKVSLD